ncbi:hypothetical protein [Pseudomonas frederiksbergensis]|uniref:Uncharacterized protein n=1 Tax=Pseudomonas frederiksbergensis TaxID=104087 RepID=A0A423HIQ6_9PSED|nr:hypothetical protein [Pseudomonas frederiksbergensis]RON13055.1 hypothetical protein BK662_29135 [Pseudomonas frederiksbergensis]
MAHFPAIEVPKWTLSLLNNLYEIERKLALHGDPGNAGRNVEKMKDAFMSEGIFYEDPMGQPFRETRTDLEAAISGSGTENLVVADVIKPIIRVQWGHAESSRVVQKGIVVVQSKEGGV